MIERLGRVNLIVGKNGVGKTTLLEALQLYASAWPERIAPLILFRRDDVAGETGTQPLPLLRSLFHGRNADDSAEARIGPIRGNSDLPELHITARMAPYPYGVPEASSSSGQGFSRPQSRLELCFKTGEFTAGLWADGVSEYAGPEASIKRLERDAGPPFVRGTWGNADNAETARQWDRISLTESENQVLRVLQLISPIEALSFVADPRLGRDRIAKVRVGGSVKPIPLAALGDGPVRIFQVAVAMEYSALAGGVESTSNLPQNVFPVLLIDEAEIGIHYSLHADLWRFIFEAARRLGVQVFATTHSLDCLRGFAAAAAESEENDGVAIRLERVPGEEQTGAVIIDREGLPIVVRDSIEVR